MHFALADGAQQRFADGRRDARPAAAPHDGTCYCVDFGRSLRFQVLQHATVVFGGALHDFQRACPRVARQRDFECSGDRGSLAAGRLCPFAERAFAERAVRYARQRGDRVDCVIRDSLEPQLSRQIAC